jgi:membrane associated rhomboid family serine protease
MCPNCRAFITTDDKICPYCDMKVGPRAVSREASPGLIAGFIPHAGFTTFIILLINLGLFAATVVMSKNLGSDNPVMDLDNRALVLFGAKYTPAIAAGQWWRLVTAGFLHGDLIHIFMNSWVLFSVGAQVEETYGTARYLSLYFVSTVVGFYASAYFSASISVGASAALFGLIGAMIAAGMRSNTALGSAIRAQYTQWVIYMLIIGLLPIFNIDMAAHIGGLAGGFGLAWLMDTPSAIRRPIDTVWRIAAGLSLALTALSFALMLRYVLA